MDALDTAAPNEEDSRMEAYLYSDGFNDRTTVSAG